jgi:hypothetical protein
LEVSLTDLEDDSFEGDPLFLTGDESLELELLRGEELCFS